MRSTSRGLGFIRISAGKVFVALSSEAANAGAIQRGINVAATDDTVNVQAGTFAGQVTVTKAITLSGAGGLDRDYFSCNPEPFVYLEGTPYYSVVTVSGVNANVESLMIDGQGDGTGSVYKFAGLAFYNAGGLADNVTTTGTTDSPLDGLQHGLWHHRPGGYGNLQPVCH
jgi:hypothetical protein